jgi:hypothetical protein
MTDVAEKDMIEQQKGGLQSFPMWVDIVVCILRRCSWLRAEVDQQLA